MSRVAISADGGLTYTSGVAVESGPLSWIRDNITTALILGGAGTFLLGHKEVGITLAAVGAGLALLGATPSSTVEASAGISFRSLGGIGRELPRPDLRRHSRYLRPAFLAMAVKREDRWRRGGRGTHLT